MGMGKLKGDNAIKWEIIYMIICTIHNSHKICVNMIQHKMRLHDNYHYLYKSVSLFPSLKPVSNAPCVVE